MYESWKGYNSRESEMTESRSYVSFVGAIAIEKPIEKKFARVKRRESWKLGVLAESREYLFGVVLKGELWPLKGPFARALPHRSGSGLSARVG